MPFEISPGFKPSLPTFPIAPLTEARKRCLRLAGLIREGAPQVEEKFAYQGCAVGAAFYAKMGSVVDVTGGGMGSWDRHIASALDLPVSLIAEVSYQHGTSYQGRKPLADSRLLIAERLERGDFDGSAA